MISPRSSGELINRLSKHVSIYSKGIERVANLVAKTFVGQQFDITQWRKCELTPDHADSSAIDWIFAINAINFSFWPDDKNKCCQIEWNGRMYRGYYGLCAAFKRALQAGIPICDPHFYTKMSFEEFQDIIRPTKGDPMPMINERYSLLREAGNILIEKFDGSFINCIQQCNNKAQNLVQLLVDNFPSYRDEADYQGHKVSFYKRAQIVVADLWACFEGEGLGKFDDIDYLTTFADYRVPQVLRYYNALEYSNTLQEIIDKGELLENGSPFEVEIRGNTIWAVELICKELRRRAAANPSELGTLSQVNPSIIDFFLWEHRLANNKIMQPCNFHKVRCIYY